MVAREGIGQCDPAVALDQEHALRQVLDQLLQSLLLLIERLAQPRLVNGHRELVGHLAHDLGVVVVDAARLAARDAQHADRLATHLQRRAEDGAGRAARLSGRSGPPPGRPRRPWP